MSQVGEQLKQNTLETANLTRPDGTKYEGSHQLDSIRRSMLIGMLIVTVFFSLICFMTGTCILKRISHRTCFVGSVVVLILFPLGTILGSCSQMLLSKAETKQLFTGQQDG